MIDIASEQLLTIREAAMFRPPSRNGRPTHVTTVHRWIKTGVRGVRLEAIPIGGSLYTSKEALQRFADRLLTGRDATSRTIQATPPVTRRRATQKAERELDRLGF